MLRCGYCLPNDMIFLWILFLYQLNISAYLNQSIDCTSVHWISIDENSCACAFCPTRFMDLWWFPKKFAHLIIMTTFHFCSCFCSHTIYHRARKWTTASKLTTNTFWAQWTDFDGLQHTAESHAAYGALYSNRYFYYRILPKRNFQRRWFLVLETYIFVIHRSRTFIWNVGEAHRRHCLVQYCRIVCARNNNWCLAWPHFALCKKSIGLKVITYLADEWEASSVVDVYTFEILISTFHTKDTSTE